MTPEAVRLPRIVVLLATYNGASFIGEQIDSIAAQQGVHAVVVMSDDGSRDGTVEIAQRVAADHGLSLTLLPKAAPSGSAAANFFRLFQDADLSNAEFVALCDQDDVWLPDKLARGCTQLTQTCSDAYSCNSTAFWPDGTERSIRKDFPQRRFDMLFESASHGCTYVLTGTTARGFAQALASMQGKAQSIDFHDWLLYAWCRATGRIWHFDSISCIRYRQSGRNVIGANAGWRASLTRLRLMRSGWLRRQSLLLADCLGISGWPIVQRLQANGWRDRVAIALQARRCRRRPRDQWVFFWCCLTCGI